MRGAIPIQGEKIDKVITKGGSSQYKFEQTTALNIGNPQKVGQGVITFNREVLGGMVYQPLRDMGVLS